jgi:hypothetical protein
MLCNINIYEWGRVLHDKLNYNSKHKEEMLKREKACPSM